MLGCEHCNDFQERLMEYTDDLAAQSIDKFLKNITESDKYKEYQNILNKNILDRLENIYSDNVLDALVKKFTNDPDEILKKLLQNQINNFTAYIDGHLHEIASEIINKSIKNSDKFNEFQKKIINNLSWCLEEKIEDTKYSLNILKIIDKVSKEMKQ